MAAISSSIAQTENHNPSRARATAARHCARAPAAEELADEVIE